MIQLLTYYAIGKWIVDVQQRGELRARYGSQIIKRLSEAMLLTYWNIGKRIVEQEMGAVNVQSMVKV